MLSEHEPHPHFAMRAANFARSA